MTRASIRILFGLLLASTAGACTRDGSGEVAADLESSVPARGVAVDARPSSRQDAPARTRLVSLPAQAGPAGTTRTRDYPDGLRQDVALPGARVALVNNGITFLARRDATETLEERVPLAKPTESAIRSEIGAAMPHVAMEVVERERSNDYGPYGLALGRVGPDTRCLFMWQWIDGNRLPRDAGLSGPASVRVRLCRAGTTFDAMAAWMDHLAIGPAPAEVAADDETPVARAHASQGQHRARRRLAEHRHGSTALARRSPQAETSLQASTAPVDGPRYLAPADRGPAPIRAASAVAPAPVTPVVHFGGDLPPEAFAGPRSSNVSPQPRS